MLKIHKRPGYDLCTLGLTQLDCIESRVEVSRVSFVNFIDILEVRKKNARKIAYCTLNMFFESLGHSKLWFNFRNTLQNQM